MHWTREDVLDQIDMPFLADLNRAWEDWPSLRKIAAAWLGHKPKERGSTNYQELLAMFPAGTIR